MFEKIVNLLGEILRNFYPEIDFSDDNIRKRKSRQYKIHPQKQIRWKIGVFE